MTIEVTRILGDGSIRRARVEPEDRADTARWQELVRRANLDLPPPYRPDPGRPVYQVISGDHSIQVAERGLAGPLRELITAVLDEGADADLRRLPLGAGPAGRFPGRGPGLPAPGPVLVPGARFRPTPGPGARPGPLLLRRAHGARLMVTSFYPLSSADSSAKMRSECSNEQ